MEYGGDTTTKARVLVVGDAGVGKTTLVQMLCTGSAQGAPARTAGCHVDVKLHRAERTGHEHFVELWDVGGSAKFAKSRGMFFRRLPLHGVILVHDLTNRRSYDHLHHWHEEVRANVAEALHAAQHHGATTPSFVDASSLLDRHGELAVPKLVVGTHADRLTVMDAGPHRAFIVQDFECPSVSVGLAESATGLGAATAEINDFFSRVLGHAMGHRGPSKAVPTSGAAMPTMTAAAALSPPGGTDGSRYGYGSSVPLPLVISPVGSTAASLAMPASLARDTSRQSAWLAADQASPARSVGVGASSTP